VFAKGHLKKYASLVGVDADDVLTDYYQMTRQDAMPPVVAVSRRRSRQELSPGPWIAVIIVILVAAASYWWFAVYSDQATAPVSTPAETPVEQRNIAASAPLQVEPEPEPAAAQMEPDPEVSEPEPEAVAAAVDDGEVRLSLSFSGECWTEVSDATGKRLFFDMGRTGQTFDLSGAAPFAVLFGNVDNVSVRVNGNDYPVSSSSPGSRTARLTIMNP
jgi:cytoskeleton protein RodZ